MRYFFWPLVLIILALRFYFFFNIPQPYNDGDKIRISSRVTSEPIRYQTSQYLKLKGLKIYLPLYPEIHYNDFVVIEGEVAEDSLKKPKLVSFQEDRSFLANLRKSLQMIFQKSLPQPHAALIAGVTIGSKANLGSDFWEALKATGTAHVVVASGMNVTLVAKFIVTILFLFLKRRRAIILASIAIWSYAALAGFDAPIVRASIMGSLAFVAQELGRLNAAVRTLLISSWLMLMLKPEWVFDLGFILSFVATLSLILFDSRVKSKLGFIPSIIREDLSTSLSAQIGVAPILFVTFGQFNILSPVINALVLWTIVPITIIGMIGGILGLIFEPLGKAVLLLSYPLTSWFIWIVQIFS